MVHRLLWFALLASSVAAQNTARVEGLVRSVSGQPIPRVTVSIRNAPVGPRLPPPPSATTNDSGEFAIDAIPPGGGYLLFAERTGYVRAIYGTTPGQPVRFTLEAGEVLRGLVIELTPQSVITGRVTDAAGDPVVGVMVQASSVGRVAVYGASSNDRGEYRVANLAPGEYQVNASESPGFRAEPGGVIKVTTYYPSATDERNAATVVVAAGAEARNIDIRIQTAKSYTIRGRVVDAASGAPVVDMPTTVEEKGGTSNVGLLIGRPITRDPTDTFTFAGLVPGAYVIHTVPTMVRNGVPVPKLLGQIEVTIVDSDVNDVVLRVGLGATIAGTAGLENGDLARLLQSTNAGGLRGAPGGRPSVILGARVADRTAGLTPAPIQPDGSFIIDGIVPGPHRWSVSGLPDTVYVKSAQFGGQDVTRSQFEVSPDANGPLEIVLARGAGDVTGIVRDASGAPLPSASVWLWPAIPNDNVIFGGARTATPDQNGGFQFKGLAPGEYYAAAFADLLSENVARRHEFLTLLNESAFSVTLSENGHAVLEAPLIPSEKVDAAKARLP